MRQIDQFPSYATFAIIRNGLQDASAVAKNRKSGAEAVCAGKPQTEDRQEQS
jgi:hypothetical protein